MAENAVAIRQSMAIPEDVELSFEALALFIVQNGGQVDLTLIETDYFRPIENPNHIHAYPCFDVRITLKRCNGSACLEVEAEGKGETPTEAMLKAIEMGRRGFSKPTFTDERFWYRARNGRYP